MKDIKPNPLSNLEKENHRLQLLLSHLEADADIWYKTLFNNTTEALVVCETFSNFPSTIIDFNTTFSHLLKCDDTQTKGRDFMDLLRKGEKRKFFIQSFNNSQEKNTQELPLIFIDGEGNEINLEISTHIFERGNDRLAIVTLRTENKHRSIINKGIEQVLLRSNQIFFGIKPEEILQFDYVSLSSFSITGYSSEQLLLNPFLFWNNCHPEDFLRIKKALQSPQTYSKDIKARFIRQDGQMIWLQFVITKYYSTTQDESTYYAVAQEITQQQKTHRQHRKKENYNQLILHIAKQLISNPTSETLTHIIKEVASHFPGDRFSYYNSMAPTGHLSINHFSPSVSDDEKTYMASNAHIWNELKHLITLQSTLVFHPADHNQTWSESQLQFFHQKHINSALIIAFKQDHKVVGFIGSTSILDTSDWDRSDIWFITQLSDLFSAINSQNK